MILPAYRKIIRQRCVAFRYTSILSRYRSQNLVPVVQSHSYPITAKVLASGSYSLNSWRYWVDSTQMKIHISKFWRPETEETAGKIGCYLLLGRHRFDSLINDCVFQIWLHLRQEKRSTSEHLCTKLAMFMTIPEWMKHVGVPNLQPGLPYPPAIYQ